MRELVLPVRVYLEDTDAQGVVYNASYFRFMERARTEWLRARGVDHDELRDEHGVVLVRAAIAEAHGARILFSQDIRRGEPNGELVCEGTAEVACVDSEAGRPRRLPEILVSELQA
jgi:acyl-CoA thioester hydrolase